MIDDWIRIAAGCLVAAAIGLFGWKGGDLTSSGGVAATVVGGLIWSFGGWEPAVLLVLFYAIGVPASRLPNPSHTRSFVAASECQCRVQSAPSSRHAGQVFANGGVPAICAVIWSMSGKDVYLLALSATLAAMTADTVAAEIGSRFGGRPWHLRLKRHVEPGVSGAISIIGTLSGALGAAVFALGSVVVGRVADIPHLESILVVFFAAIVGLFVDTFLGALVQAMYRCGACGKVMDAPAKQQTGDALVFGIRWFGNSVVNFATMLILAVGLLLL